MLRSIKTSAILSATGFGVASAAAGSYYVFVFAGGRYYLASVCACACACVNLECSVHAYACMCVVYVYGGVCAYVRTCAGSLCDISDDFSPRRCNTVPFVCLSSSHIMHTLCHTHTHSHQSLLHTHTHSCSRACTGTTLPARCGL